MDASSVRLPGTRNLQLHALLWSDDAGSTPLVFVHGFGHDSHVWDASAPLVAPHYRTLAIDLPGHGDSDRDPQQLYDPLSLSESLECALDALNAERVVLVGHSLGGRVSMHFAIRRPERMAGLVLVDSAPQHDPRGSARIRGETESAELVFRSVREYETQLAEHYPATKPAVLAGLARHWLRERDDGMFEPKIDPIFRRAERGGRTQQELDAESDAQREMLWDRLPKVECPTLLIRGSASDILSADVSDRLVEDVLPNGHFVEIPRASHSVMLDNPEAFNQALTDFVLG